MSTDTEIFDKFGFFKLCEDVGGMSLNATQLKNCILPLLNRSECSSLAEFLPEALTYLGSECGCNVTVSMAMKHFVGTIAGPLEEGPEIAFRIPASRGSGAYFNLDNAWNQLPENDVRFAFLLNVYLKRMKEISNDELLQMYIDDSLSHFLAEPKQKREMDRIYRILDLIGDYWENHPDTRFGQIVETIKARVDVSDLFYVEDDKVEEILRNLID